jgi:hypothetical protein
LTLKKNAIEGLQIDLPDNSGLSLDPAGLKIATNGIKGSNIDFVANRPVYNNIGANNQVDFRFNTNEFQLMAGTHPTTPYGLELKKIGAARLNLFASSLEADDKDDLRVKLDPNGALDTKTSGFSLKLQGHSALLMDSTGLKIDLLNNATSQNISGLLLNTATADGLHINLSGTNSGLEIDSTGLKIIIPTTSGLQLTTTGLKIDLPTLSGLQMDATGLKINLDTTNGGLAIDSGGYYI